MAIAALPERGASDLWLPRPVKVQAVREEIAPDPATKRVVTLSLERGDLDYLPGQFLQVTVFGAGEIPISISSAHGLPGALYITVRAAGTVSQMLTELRPGAVVGVRGPCGNHFALEAHRGRDLVFVAGGIGLAPLRGVLWQALLERERYGRIVVLHGARTPRELLYPWQYADWRAKGVELHLSVDRGDGRWELETDPPRVVGLITTLFDRARIVPDRSSVFLCGPPIMIENGARDLVRRIGVPASRVVSTLERHMKCGVGKCGHCIVVDRYVCVDGPVFRYDELLALEHVEPPW
jgi:NAD(P)H-flavin reductase